MKSNFAVLLFIGICCILESCGENYTQGERIYQSQCSNCHMEDGKGLKNMIPALDQNPILLDNQKLVCTIILGKNSSNVEANTYMPEHPKMNDVEMSNLVNFMKNKFSIEKSYVKMEDVAKLRENCN